MTIRWYSIDNKLRSVDGGPIDLEGAYEIIDGYFARLQSQYHGAEEALAATMFGFTRADGTYMQICIHTPEWISVEHDFSLIKNPLRRLVSGRWQGNERLASRDELRDRTKLFFTQSKATFRQLLRSVEPPRVHDDRVTHYALRQGFQAGALAAFLVLVGMSVLDLDLAIRRSSDGRFAVVVVTFVHVAWITMLWRIARRARDARRYRATGGALSLEDDSRDYWSVLLTGCGWAVVILAVLWLISSAGASR